MKTVTKLSLAAITFALTASAFADHQKLVVTDNAHGSLRFHYRPVEHTPTIAVFARDHGVGHRLPSTDDRAPKLRFTLRDTGHGSLRPQFVAAE